MSKEAIKMRPAPSSAVLQLENSPCSISDLIANNHPMVMELCYLGPRGSESDRSGSGDRHSPSSSFHRHLQHITPAEKNRLQIRRVKHAAHGATWGREGPFVNLRAAGHKVFFWNYLYLVYYEIFFSRFPVSCSTFCRQICASVILLFAILK